MKKYTNIEVDMRNYLKAGERRALSLNNRGPIKFNKDGTLHKDIMASYAENGFYIFEDVYKKSELLDIENDLFDIFDRLPKSRLSKLDKKGRPALSSDCEAHNLYWSKPLGDPFGGTKLANGRHPVKMVEPDPEKGAPEEIIYLILGALQFSEAYLRAYAHPLLLKVAESINGEDFVPFTDALFIKEPGLGASVAWHQDGTTHWNSPIWDQFCHGFNFMAQLYGSTAANGVWIVPGTHKLGKINIKKLVSDAGTVRLPNAIPIVCNAGDVAITNRQVLHCSFANTSPDWRVTVNFGFHKKSSVLNVKGGGLHAKPKNYDENHIKIRSRLIPYAINARQQKYIDETPYKYKPLNSSEYKWNSKAKDEIKDYNLLDMSI
jgi:ectoine hydroxylase-related dioxygenase (phytanoyl-CoA dioxygenase family)